MPIVAPSFHPPALLRSAHVQTVLPFLLRNPRMPEVRDCELETSDGDLLSYRYYKTGNQRLAIISHGLEGSYDSGYVRGMVRSVSNSGWDALTWNMRGCGGATNRLITWYHSGKSDDLKAVVLLALSLGYKHLSLIGFSIGGNITLKYLGEEGRDLPAQIKSASVISVPMDLRGSAQQLARPNNRIYIEHLLRPLRKRMRTKSVQFPDAFDLRGLANIRSFYEFDARFTAPVHGFGSVEEYWERSSSLNFISTISIPTLAISALDDPFLSQSCIPFSIAQAHPYLHLDAPKFGGHVGFIDSVLMHETYAERRAVAFIADTGDREF